MPARLAPLDASASGALGLIAVTGFVLRRAIWDAPQPPVLPHVAARIHEETVPIAKRLWHLACLLVRHATDTETVPPSTFAGAQEALVAAIGALDKSLLALVFDAEIVADARRAFRADEGLLADETGMLLHEAGLETLDLDVVLATDADGGPLLAWRPIDPDDATIQLLDPLLMAAEHLSGPGRLLEFECVASTWWFERWAPSRKATRRNRFPTYARLREWVFGDRITLAFGAPVVTALVAPPWAGRLPAKQAALARCLPRSHSSFFVIRSRDDARTIMEDLVDGRVFQVHEHNPTMKYRPGDVAAGRLIPVRAGTWLRSPGMVTYTPHRGAEPLASPGSMLREIRTAIGDPAIAVESLISTLALAERVPHNVAPAPSKREADERLHALHKALKDAGLWQEAPLPDAPPEMRRVVEARNGQKVVGPDVDQTVAEYARALAAQVGNSGR